MCDFRNNIFFSDKLIQDDFFSGGSNNFNLLNEIKISDLFDVSELDFNHDSFLEKLQVEVNKFESLLQQNCFSSSFAIARKKIHDIEIEEKSFYVSTNCSYDITIDNYINNSFSVSEKLKKMKKNMDEKYFVLNEKLKELRGIVNLLSTELNLKKSIKLNSDDFNQEEDTIRISTNNSIKNDDRVFEHNSSIICNNIHKSGYSHIKMNKKNESDSSKHL